MADGLTLDELAARSGAPVDALREWAALGLIGRGGDDTFGPEDVQRIRLVRLLLRRGIGLEAIARAEREQGFLARYIEVMFPAGVGAIHSLPEVARMLGVDPGWVQRFLEASGLSDRANLLDEEDVRALKAARIALEAGFPEEALVQLAHVYADALGRVAEAEARLFHFYVHERLKTQGMSGDELMAASEAARSQTEPLVEPFVLYFHRRGMERARREDAVMHLQEDVGLVGPAQLPGQLSAAIVFVDLARFTPLTVAMGDHAAAEVLERFSRIVRDAVSRHEGRVVKQLGDAFMLMFLEPRSAVTCALDIEDRTAAEPQFPAVRSGLHWGPVLYREGDYVGASVNVAARVAAEAQRHQVLVTAPVRREAGGLSDVEFVPLGTRRLKGLGDQVELFQAVRPAGDGLRQRQVDPVCGMELGVEEIAATLSLEGRERVFCSQECLQRFVAAPERYRDATRRSP
jgi:adenylate cyclase